MVFASQKDKASGVDFEEKVQVILPDGSVQIRPVHGPFEASMASFDGDRSLAYNEVFMDAVTDDEATNLAQLCPEPTATIADRRLL
jgi:hypothetical protein